MRVRNRYFGAGQIKWHDYAARFVFGGLVTAVAGIIANKFGPAIGGLFLGFSGDLPCKVQR